MTDGNYRSRNGRKEEVRPIYGYEYDYSASAIWNMIRNKAEIIELRNNGSFAAAELLVDCEIFEKRYLTPEQRSLIEYVYVRGYETKKAAKLLGISTIGSEKILQSIYRTLKAAIK